MKRIVFIILGVVMLTYVTGCGKKQSAEQAQEPASMEDLSKMNAQQPAAEQKAPVAAPAAVEQPAVPQAAAQAAPKLENLPPSGPYKPSTQEIQTALKNAGYYSGAIDGKAGPKTKKAIEEFQKANGLKADGKVGAKTWNLLSKHLSVQPVNPPEKR